MPPTEPGGAAESKARQFIDEIIQINKRHGYPGDVPPKAYKRAVRRVADATEAVKAPHADRDDDAPAK